MRCSCWSRARAARTTTTAACPYSPSAGRRTHRTTWTTRKGWAGATRHCSTPRSRAAGAGDYDGAIEDFTAALDEDDKRDDGGAVNPKYLYDRGQCYRQMGSRRERGADLRKALEETPGNSGCCTELE